MRLHGFLKRLWPAAAGVGCVAGCAAPAAYPPPGAGYGMPVASPFGPPAILDAAVDPPVVMIEPGSLAAPAPPPMAAPGFPPPPIVLPNPVLVPATDRDFAWDQIVDVVDDYFKVEREDRVRQMGDVLTEGRIDTFPQTGATLFEPWRRDSVGFYERLESTMQSIRRQAAVRVMPDSGGYLVEVVVVKELEDVERPAHATAGAATFRYDDSIDRYTEPIPSLLGQIGDQPRAVSNPALTAGWIPLGRDFALEQTMLAQIQARLGGGMIPLVPAAPTPAPYYQPEPLPAPVPGPAPGVLPVPAAPGIPAPPAGPGWVPLPR